MTHTLSHTNVVTLIRYLTDAATLYDSEARRTKKSALANRARLIRKITNKIKQQ